MMELKTKKIIWRAFVFFSVMLCSYGFFLVKNQNAKVILLTLLFLSSAAFIVHAYIFDKTMYLGGFELELKEKKSRFFALFSAVFFWFTTFSYLFGDK